MSRHKQGSSSSVMSRVRKHGTYNSIFLIQISNAACRVILSVVADLQRNEFGKIERIVMCGREKLLASSGPSYSSLRNIGSDMFGVRVTIGLRGKIFPGKIKVTCRTSTQDQSTRDKLCRHKLWSEATSQETGVHKIPSIHVYRGSRNSCGTTHGLNSFKNHVFVEMIW